MKISLASALALTLSFQAPLSLLADGSFPGPDHEYIAPGADAVRSPCPAINLLANHGFIDRSGKDINVTFMYEQLAAIFDTTVGFATAVGTGATNLGLTEEKDGLVVLTIDSLFATMAQQHDASFTRKDEFFGDESVPVDMARIDALLPDGKETITKAEIMEAQVANIYDSRLTNPEYRFPEGAMNSMSAQATLFLAFGQDADLETVPASWLRDYMVENKLPEGYKPLGLFNETNPAFPISFAPDSIAGMVRAEFKTSIVEAVEANLTSEAPSSAPVSDPSSAPTTAPSGASSMWSIDARASLLVFSTITAVVTGATLI